MQFRRWFFAFVTVLLLLPAARIIQAAGEPRIDSPVNGSVVQGVVSVTGSSQVDGFRSAEISYASEIGPGTWILIDTSSQPVTQGKLAAWDTTTIVDGSYRLRLRVLLNQGGPQEIVVNRIKVRNTTPGGSAQQIAAQAYPALLIPSPSSQPQNPATIDLYTFSMSMAQGAIFAVIVFIVLGLYIGIRNFIHR